MLTKKQKNLLIYINKKIRSSGISPSYEEMKNSLNLKSKSGIHRLITGLEERGFIRRLPHRARALEVLRLPEYLDYAPTLPAKRKSGFVPNVISGGFKTDVNISDVSVELSDTMALQVPLYGRIAAVSYTHLTLPTILLV